MIPTTKAKQRVYLRRIIDELNVLYEQLHSRPSKPRRTTEAPAITDAMRGDINSLYNAGYAMQEIARTKGISIGRVSEVISGKRT